MHDDAIPPAARDLADTLQMERARMSVSMTKIYRAAGFGAVMAAVQGCLVSLSEQVRDERGPVGDGWAG